MESLVMLVLPLRTVIKSLKRVFLSLALIWSSCALAKPLVLEATLSSYQTVALPFTLDENDFVQGEYKTSASIKSITLVDEHQKPIRRLSEPNAQEERFLFTATYSGKYALVIEALAKEASVNIAMDILKPLSQKPTTIQEPIISPTLLKIQEVSDTKAFWEEIQHKGTPLVEEKDDQYILTFLYQGAQHNVQIMGAPIGDIAYMQKMSNNDIWYKSFIVPKGTRLSYQLAPDVPIIMGTPREQRVAILSTLQADPLNKTPMPYSHNEDKFHKVSTIELPQQAYTDWAKAKSNQQGILHNYTLKSKLLNNERAIDVYLPDGFSKEKTYPVLFLFDGKEYQSKVQTPTILDNLIATRKIPPLIAVFVANANYQSRGNELPCNPLLADFMAKELLPWFQTTITSHIDAAKTIISGSSYGGLASAYTAFRYPELFGNVLSFSGSFWWKSEHDTEMEWLTRQIAQSAKRPISFYLYAGLFETGEHTIDILEANRHLRTVLNAKDYTVFYEEFKGGHDYFSWGVTLADGLMRILK